MNKEFMIVLLVNVYLFMNMFLLLVLVNQFVNLLLLLEIVPVIVEHTNVPITVILLTVKLLITKPIRHWHSHLEYVLKEETVMKPSVAAVVRSRTAAAATYKTNLNKGA
jgi:hypothetical protein